MIRIFGFELNRAPKPEIPTFAPPVSDDGAINVVGGGSYGSYVDLDGSVRSEAELINKYRQMAEHPEVETAIDDIINESIVLEDGNDITKINTDKLTQLPPKIKQAIEAEFLEAQRLLEFNSHAYEIYKRWYVDGRLYFHCMIDPKTPEAGIQELRYIDPRKIRKIREIKKKRDAATNIPVQQEPVTEYYIYNDKGFYVPTYGSVAAGTTSGIAAGIRIAKDSIIQTTSGISSVKGDMILSYLHKAIKPLNMLRTMEDSLVIYRISRAPERRIFYIDVGNLPKLKAEQYLRDIMAKFKNKVVYDSTTGEIRDDRKFMCYAMDTKIPLLDGRTLELQEIIKEHNEGKKNWVYSCDPLTGKFIPGPITWAGVTKHNAEVVKVTFDNGKSVVCTPDHKFPVWNKGFVEAKDLTTEDSIIPGYRRAKPIIKNGVEYEQIYKNDESKWEFTHREVSKWKKEQSINEEMVYDIEYLNKPKNIIHHKNFNRFNNNPENLILMNNKDHTLYHHNIQSIKYTDEILSLVENCAKNNLQVKETLEHINNKINIGDWIKINFDRNPKNRDIKNLFFTHKDLHRICKVNDKKNWKSYCREYDTQEYESNGRKQRGIFKKGSFELNQYLSEKAKKRTPSNKTWKIITPNGSYELVENLSKFCRENTLNRNNIKRSYGSQGYKAAQLRNHKILSVEFLSEKHTVGSISVDAYETYHSPHTYLLDAGVYTKNTMLEDFWLPRRENGRGTEITTLPGGQNLGQIEDIIYFQKKLFNSLNVPVTRLEPEQGFGIGRATEVSRDEVKFSKFIRRMRMKFSTLFTKIIGKNLVLKGIVTIEQWENISQYISYQFAKDNYYDELKNAEVLNNRMNLLNALQPFVGVYFSSKWVKKNVLRQDDDEMEQMKGEIMEDLQDPLMQRAQMQQMGEPGPLAAQPTQMGKK